MNNQLNKYNDKLYKEIQFKENQVKYLELVIFPLVPRGTKLYLLFFQFINLVVNAGYMLKAHHR